jgi:hypothetical protein
MEAEILTLKAVARRLDRVGIEWAVFAGAAATVYGATRPVTDVDILLPVAEQEIVAYFTRDLAERYLCG